MKPSSEELIVPEPSTPVDFYRIFAQWPHPHSACKANHQGLIAITPQAALARATELDPSIPTIAFLITDAQPHTGLHASPAARGCCSAHSTAQHELGYLAAKYPTLSPSDARDFFKCFQQTTLAHFGSNLVLNCVVYNTRGLSAPQPCATQLLFASIAQQTGGMLMQPESRNAAAMAAGLVSVVKALMARLGGTQHEGLQQQQQQQQQQQEDGIELGAAAGGVGLQGFRLIDLSGVHPDRSSEGEPAGVVEYGDTQELFNIAMDRMVAGEGSVRTQCSFGGNEEERNSFSGSSRGGGGSTCLLCMENVCGEGGGREQLRTRVPLGEQMDP
jgi:hypothetical protein